MSLLEGVVMYLCGAAFASLIWNVRMNKLRRTCDAECKCYRKLADILTMHRDALTKQNQAQKEHIEIQKQYIAELKKRIRKEN